MKQNFLTVKEAATIKGVIEGTVRRRIARGKLPATKVGDIWIIRRKDLDAWKVVGHRPKKGEDG